MTSIPSLAAAAFVLALVSSTPASAAQGDPTSPSPDPAAPATIQPKVGEMFRNLPRVECVLVGPLVPNKPGVTVRVRNNGVIAIPAGKTVVWTLNTNPSRSGELVLTAPLQPQDLLFVGVMARQTDSCSAHLK